MTGEPPTHPGPAHPQCRWKRELGFLAWGLRPSCPPLPGLRLPTLLPVTPPPSEPGHFLFAASPLPPLQSHPPPCGFHRALFLTQEDVPPPGPLSATDPGDTESPAVAWLPDQWCPLAFSVGQPGPPSHLHRHLPECHEGPLAPSSALWVTQAGATTALSPASLCEMLLSFDHFACFLPQYETTIFIRDAASVSDWAGVPVVSHPPCD